MTPAEELTAAADKLDALIAEATDGPWRDMPMGSEGSTILAGGNTVSTSRRVGRTGEFADAAYIAAMSPKSGARIVNLLRREARALGHSPTWVDGSTYRLPDEDLLALARLINGGGTNG